MKVTILILLIFSLFHFIHSNSLLEKKQLPTGIYIRNLDDIRQSDISKNLECLKDLKYDFVHLNLYNHSSFSLHAEDISDLINQDKNVISFSITPTVYDDAQDMLNSLKGLLSEGVDFLWLNIEHIADNVIVINSYISTAMDIGFRLGIVHESDLDLTTFDIPIRHLLEVSLPEQWLLKCSITAETFQQLVFTEENNNDRSSSPLASTSSAPMAIETAFTITFYEEIQWESFPGLLDCLRKHYDTIFLTIYEDHEFLGNVTNSIPHMLAHNFTLYIGIAPLVHNSSTDYDNLIETVNSKLASFGVETKFLFYYTNYGGKYIADNLNGIRLAKTAIQKRNMKMGVATNQAAWNLDYNQTGLYSDLPLWSTDKTSFSNFSSYGGWAAPIVANTNYYVVECLSDLWIEKSSFLTVQYKPELLKGMSVIPIPNFSTTVSMSSTTPKPSIAQSSSATSASLNKTTSSPMKTTQYPSKSTFSSTASTSSAPMAIETAFTITFYEEIQWESFPGLLDCLRKHYDTIFLTIYEDHEFLGNVTNSIPHMLAHNFTLYIGIAPLVHNSSTDYDNLIETVNSKLASFGVETKFLFYYTNYGGKYIADNLNGIRLAKTAIQKRNMKMGVATNQAAWNLDYNQTGLYSDLPLWSTDKTSFSNFSSYGGWAAPIVANTNYYVVECLSDLWIEKSSFLTVQYKPELLKGMSVIPIPNFSTTVSMSSTTPKPSIAQSSSATSASLNKTTSSPMKTTQYPSKSTFSSTASTSSAPMAIETAFTITFYEEIQWESFPGLLDCLRKHYDTIFLTIYEDHEFLGNVTNSIPHMLAHNFTLYIGIAPLVHNSSTDYDNLIETVNSKLASFGVETKFLFYYTNYGGKYIADNLNGIRLAKTAIQKRNMKMGVATNQAAWNLDYNQTGLYSDLPLWSTDKTSFSNFSSYGGWAAPIVANTNYYVVECLSDLWIEKSSFLTVQYKPELLKGMSVIPIPNFSTTVSMSSTTPKPSIAQSSSATSASLNKTTSSPMKTTQYPSKSTFSSTASTSSAPMAIETAFTITFYEEIQWESFPGLLDCLRKHYDTIFLTIYEDHEFLGNVTNSIPHMLAHNFTLYIGIAPLVHNSSTDYDNLIETVNSKLASFGVETKFLFYYTNYGGKYIADNLNGIRLAKTAIQKRNMKMGVATNQAAWNLDYNQTGLYSDLPLWSTDKTSFSNFSSYGGWAAPIVANTNYYVVECLSDLWIEKSSFLTVQYKPELLKGMSVIPIPNFSTTVSMSSTTTKPSIAQSSSTASSTTIPSSSVISNDATTTSSLGLSSSATQSSTSVQRSPQTSTIGTTTVVHTTTSKNSYFLIPHFFLIGLSIFIS